MKVLRRIWPYLVLAVLLVGNGLVWINRDNIADWWRLRDYAPPETIVQLAQDTTMTDKARRLFYINHPSLENKQDFNAHCADQSKETSVLGCYHGNRQGIYLYAVTDERLAGVLQVTAAHEMLHQAYDRLDEAEKGRIGALLEAYYQSNQLSADIKAKIDGYRAQKDVDIVNEMHSIFGSEVRDLPSDLEQYYAQYFVDRSAIVSFSEAYRGEFTRREALVAQYDAQLASLKTDIESNKGELEIKSTYLKEKEKAITQDVARQDQASYDADVRAYNTTVDSYNSQLAATRKLIEKYNQIVNERNTIAVQEQELQEALDSRLEPSVKQ